MSELNYNLEVTLEASGNLIMDFFAWIVNKFNLVDKF